MLNWVRIVLIPDPLGYWFDPDVTNGSGIRTRFGACFGGLDHRSRSPTGWVSRVANRKPRLRATSTDPWSNTTMGLTRQTAIGPGISQRHMQTVWRWLIKLSFQSSGSERAQARKLSRVWEGGPEGLKHRLKKNKKEVDRRSQSDSMGFYNKERIK